MTKDIRTDFEKQRAAHHLSICNEYLKLEKSFPDASITRLCNVLADQFKMTGQGVKNILKRNGMFGKGKEKSDNN